MFKTDMPHLDLLTGPQTIASLTEDELKDLQRGLALLGFPLGRIDGKIGPKSRNAWAEFKTDDFPGNPELVGPESVALLRKRCAGLPSASGVDLSTKEATIKAIRLECQAQGIGRPSQSAYVLATTQWETAQTFRPVREAFFVSKQEQAAEAWRKANLRYYPYYGRGFVQLTWDNNYEKYGEMLKLDLLGKPDLALDGHVALFVLVHGFKIGGFTGRKLTDFITASQTDFISARRCINGTDKAQEIADIAEGFLGSG